MNRLYNLDYLRGLAAFGIMIYHYITWTAGKFNADTIIARIGIYGVSIFYVLSGLTLYYVYHNRMQPSVADLQDFFKKRILRIYPLLWLATLLTIIVSDKEFMLSKFLLNLSGLFGFIKWNEYYATGAWSIGNELVFYCFFPLFIWFTKISRWLLALCGLIFLTLYIYFAFIKLNPNLPLVEQWDIYVNPFNQVFLFLSGYLIGLLFTATNLKDATLYLLVSISVALFIFYPTSTEVIDIVTGSNRLVFTLTCILICLFFYKANLKLPTWLHKVLSILGETSYSLYLIHPIVFTVVSLLISVINFELSFLGPLENKIVTKLTLLCVSLILSLVLSVFIYRKFEVQFIKLGKRKVQTA